MPTRSTEASPRPSDCSTRAGRLNALRASIRRAVEADTRAEYKTGKARHIVLTDEGAAFFGQHCAGRGGHERMFTHASGSEWKKSDQKRPMAEAVARAKITPPITFHGLRHTWASLAVMNGVPLMVVARNLGHVDTTMVEKHYGHLAPSFIAEAIRAGAPRFPGASNTTVVPLHKAARTP